MVFVRCCRGGPQSPQAVPHVMCSVCDCPQLPWAPKKCKEPRMDDAVGSIVAGLRSLGACNNALCAQSPLL